MPTNIRFDLQLLKAWLPARQRRVIAEPALRPCAVLVPIYMRDSEPVLVLTRRSDTLRSHRGQVSFPGGRVEPHDESLVAAALRESEEEIGLAARDVEVIGPLDDTVTLSTNRITPYVGLIPADYPFRPDPREVASILEIPIAAFAEPEDFRVEHLPHPDGAVRPVYFFTIGQEVVWGATARIIRDSLLPALQRTAEPR